MAPGFGLVARQQKTINQFDSRHTIESKSMRWSRFSFWKKISHFQDQKARKTREMRVGKSKKFWRKHGAAVLMGPNQTLAVKRGTADIANTKKGESGTKKGESGKKIGTMSSQELSQDTRGRCLKLSHVWRGWRGA